VALAVVPAAPTWLLAVLMVLVGLGGPLVMPPVTGVLLNSVPSRQAGTASGVFNTSRQVGGALAIAVFGALLGSAGTFVQGLRVSLLIAAGTALAAAAVAPALRPRASIQSSPPGVWRPGAGSPTDAGFAVQPQEA
jgi:MFS transporter, DHA2 family, methylenomycin A resistance protein